MPRTASKRDPADDGEGQPAKPGKRATSEQARTVRVTIDLPVEIHREARLRVFAERTSLNSVGRELFTKWLAD